MELSLSQPMGMELGHASLAVAILTPNGQVTTPRRRRRESVKKWHPKPPAWFP